MSGRYFLNAAPAELAQHFAVPVADDFPPRYNIAPTQPVCIIRQNPLMHAPERNYAIVRWGFIPDWIKDPQEVTARTMVHARAETIAEKASFKNAFRRRRCLIPANGFYEWRTENKLKQPWCVALPEQRLFALAGIWEHWMGADGSELETVATITRPAGLVIENIHNRELLAIPPEGYDDWLHANELDFSHYHRYLKSPCPPWQIHKVSRRINSSRAEGADLLTPNEGQLNLL